MKASRVRDYTIYIGIGIGVFAFIGWLATHYAGISKREFKWAILLLETPILFGYAIAGYRRCFVRPLFWVMILGLLAIHLTLFSIVLAHVNWISPLWYGAIAPIETVGIEEALLATGYAPGVSLARFLLRDRKRK
jgi:hypothetical protein